MRITRRHRPVTRCLKPVSPRSSNGRAECLLYANWFEDHGDPRGELILIQHALESARRAEWARLKTREAQLFGEYPEHFYGPLATSSRTQTPRVDWRCGFVHALSGLG